MPQSQQGRYYQPKDAKDAMRYVQKLFNQYRDAPLTDELLAYHQKLTNYIQRDVTRAAQQEGNANRAQTAQQMAAYMRQWLQIRAQGKPYPGKMKHFKLEAYGSHPTIHNREVKGHHAQPTLRKTMHH
ncbi:hypothetical protein IV38_GL000787 [Lactobacillus selangorensis]|uniref:Uncharacterized protein n=1 Tax=Lactobacillus selangorensis TaxID=81857 RepID=A0A0R2G7B3_9LACO|nr:hypothetical protein [Lactobacillus selangorensis]KRN28588.1 hypothetical protein IV38_GL000787 [Lactobacillus selangorensis]KRN33002.1 hypothetical protein IV40_GL001066 [Lactobacillus selangorensis]